MLIALNTRLRRGRRIVLLVATLLLGFAVLAAHGAVAGGHMAPAGGGHVMVAGGHEMPGGDLAGSIAADPGDALMAMCLAIAQTAALALGALALAAALAAALRRGPAMRWPVLPVVLTPTRALTHRARPPDLTVLQVCRR